MNFGLVKRINDFYFDLSKSHCSAIFELISTEKLYGWKHLPSICHIFLIASSNESLTVKLYAVKRVRITLLKWAFKKNESQSTHFYTSE